MTLVSRAWMLDAQEFHRELNVLLADAVPEHDFRTLRDRAAALWRETDPIARTYLEVFRVHAAGVRRLSGGSVRSGPTISVTGIDC